MNDIQQITIYYITWHGRLCYTVPCYPNQARVYEVIGVASQLGISGFMVKEIK